jgi:hypothetical protein
MAGNIDSIDCKTGIGSPALAAIRVGLGGEWDLGKGPIVNYYCDNCVILVGFTLHTVGVFFPWLHSTNLVTFRTRTHPTWFLVDRCDPANGRVLPVLTNGNIHCCSRWIGIGDGTTGKRTFGLIQHNGDLFHAIVEIALPSTSSLCCTSGGCCRQVAGCGSTTHL